MHLEIITAEASLYEGDVDALAAPGTEGQLGILPNHAALLAVLQPGELRYRLGGTETSLVVSGGFIEVGGNRVMVLADAAEHVDEIDEARAEEARARARARINERTADVDLERALASLRRAQVRLDTSRRRRHRGVGAPDREGTPSS